MPSVVENMALIVGGAVAGTALTSAFVAPGPVADLPAAGYAIVSVNEESQRRHGEVFRVDRH